MSTDGRFQQYLHARSAADRPGVIVYSPRMIQSRWEHEANSARPSSSQKWGFFLCFSAGVMVGAILEALAAIAIVTLLTPG